MLRRPLTFRDGLANGRQRQIPVTVIRRILGGRPIPSRRAILNADMPRPGRTVSRGPGRWQRELLVATGGVHTATVSGVVRTCVPEPDRNDFTAARRGAKGLAMAGKVMALYVYACQRCGRVQDHEPERCCGVVRSSLAVTRPGRALPHLAPPPTGARCPPWIGVSGVGPLPSPVPWGGWPRLAPPTWRALPCGVRTSASWTARPR